MQFAKRVYLFASISACQHFSMSAFWFHPLSDARFAEVSTYCESLWKMLERQRCSECENSSDAGLAGSSHVLGRIVVLVIQALPGVRRVLRVESSKSAADQAGSRKLQTGPIASDARDVGAKDLFAGAQEDVEAEVLWDVGVLGEVVGRGEPVDLPPHALLGSLYIRLRRGQTTTKEVSRAYRWARWPTLSTNMEQRSQPASGQRAPVGRTTVDRISRCILYYDAARASRCRRRYLLGCPWSVRTDRCPTSIARFR